MQEPPTAHRHRRANHPAARPFDWAQHEADVWGTASWSAAARPSWARWALPVAGSVATAATAAWLALAAEALVGRATALTVAAVGLVLTVAVAVGSWRAADR
jgi:hypothetical protein